MLHTARVCVGLAAPYTAPLSQVSKSSAKVDWRMRGLHSYHNTLPYTACV